MAKRRNVPTTASEGLPVDDPGKFIKECARVLRTALDNPRISFVTSEALPRHTRVWFRADPATRARRVQDGEEFPVILLGGQEVADSWLPQWLGIELHFEKPALDNYLT